MLLLKTPKPARNTVVPWSTPGDHEMPSRGLGKNAGREYPERPDGEAKVRPPSAENALAGSWEMGDFAYAAAAACATELTALGSNPFTIRLYRSTSGVSCSKRMPALMVRWGLTRQSS